VSSRPSRTASRTTEQPRNLVKSVRGRLRTLLHLVDADDTTGKSGLEPFRQCLRGSEIICRRLTAGARKDDIDRVGGHGDGHTADGAGVREIEPQAEARGHA